MSLPAASIAQRLVPIVGAQCLGLLCGIAGVALVSRVVNPVDYGSYSVFVTLATLGGAVIYAGPLKFLGRHWLAAPDRPSLLRTTFLALARKTPWLLLACAAATALFAPEQKAAYAALLFAAAILVTVAQLAQTTLQAAREHWRDFGLTAVASLTRSFVPPVLYTATGAGFLALLGGFLVHAALTALAAAPVLRRWRSDVREPDTHAAPPPVYEGLQFVFLAAAAWVLVGVNRWIVVGFYGAETGGYFALATNVGAVLTWMSGAVFLQYAQPGWFAAEPSSAESRRALLRSVDRVAFAHAFVAAFLALLLHLSMPALVGTLVSPRYAEAAHFVFATGCAAIPATTALYYHTLLVAARREAACTRTDLAGAACLVVGSLAAAALGLASFKHWLVLSALVPWAVNRPLARRALLGGA